MSFSTQFIKKKEKDEMGLFGTLNLSLALFVLSIIFVYFIGGILSSFFFILLLFFFFISKKDYLWFAFAFIISNTPMLFFAERYYEAQFRLPIYNLFPGVSFSFFDLFLIVAFVKSIKKKTKFHYSIKIEAGIIIGVYLILVGLIHGYSSNMLINIAGSAMGLTIFYSFPRLIKSPEEFIKFITAASFIVFLELINQIFYLRTGDFIVKFLDPSVIVDVKNSVTGELRPVIYSYNVVSLIFICSFFFFTENFGKKYKIYYIFVIAAIIVTIVLTQTRQAVVFLMLIIIFNYKLIFKRISHVLYLLSAGILLIIIMNRFIDIDFWFNQSWERIGGSIEYQDQSARFSDTAGGRIHTRLPVLISHIGESPIFGFGFSDKYFEYYDGHLGGILVGILQGGILGILAYLVFIWHIFKENVYYEKLCPSSINKTMLHTITMGLLALFIMNIFIDPLFKFPIGRFFLSHVYILMILSQIIILDIRNGIFISKGGKLSNSR